MLIDIQKLKIVPADSFPIIMSEMNLHSSEIISEKKIKSYQLKNNEFGSIGDEVSESIKLVSPQVSYRDGPIVNLKLEDVGVLGVNSTKLAGALPSSSTSKGLEGELVVENGDLEILTWLFVLAFCISILKSLMVLALINPLLFMCKL